MDGDRRSRREEGQHIQEGEEHVQQDAVRTSRTTINTEKQMAAHSEAPEGHPHIHMQDDEPPPEPIKKKKKMSKAEKKELKRQEHIAFRKLEMRDHLRRELELSKRAAARGKLEWQRMVRDIKIEELRIELHQWYGKTTRLKEQKDDMISSMLNDIDITQESHRRAQLKSVERMKFLESLYKVLVNCVKQLYESEASGMLQEFKEELFANEEEQIRVRDNCEKIMHSTNMVTEKRMLDDYKVYIERYEECFNVEIHKRYLLEKKIRLKMLALHNQLKDFLNAIKNSALDPKKYEKYRVLMERQINYVDEAERLKDSEFLKNRYLIELKHQLFHQDVQNQRKLNDLRLEKTYFQQIRHSIEKSMEEENAMMKEKMLIITGESYHISKNLRELVKFGELLLTIFLNCRKLQTETEKVISGATYIAPLPKDPEQAAAEEAYFELKTLDLATHIDLTDNELREQLLLMKTFWRRVAVAESQNLMLQQEKEQLTAENQKYINFIKSMNKADNVDELMEALTIELVKPRQDYECPDYNLRPARPKRTQHD